MPAAPTVHPAPSTREALLDAALERLTDVGWTSFSFGDLAKTVGIRTASIHYHFPTKGDLGVAVVERFREQSTARELDLVATYPHVGERLRAIGRMIEELTCGRMCPISALQAEYAVLPEAMQRLVTEWVEHKLTSLTTWLEAGRQASELRFPGAARQQALLVWSVIEYGQQLTRTNPNATFSSIIDHLVHTMTP